MNTLVRLLAPVLGLVAFIAAAMFFSVLFLIGAVLVLAIWAHLWWKTRHLRRQPGGWPPRPPGGDVIEGEYTVHEHAEGRITRDDDGGRGDAATEHPRRD